MGDASLDEMGADDMGAGDMGVGDMGVRDMGVRDMAVEDLGTLPEGTLDPDEVYLHGFRMEGMCDQDAIEDFRSGTAPLDGFGCSGELPGIIRPADGRVIFKYTVGDDALRVFQPESTDDFVSTPQCAAVSWFRIEPDTSDILYRCSSCAPSVTCANTTFRDSGGTYPYFPPLLTGFRGWLPGYDGISLRYTETAVTLESASGTVVVQTDLSVFDTNSYEIRAVRAIPEGFRVITVEEELVFSSFIIARDGTVTLEGEYPAWNGSISYPGACRLSLDGALLCLSYLVGMSADVVVRFELGANAFDIVLDERTDPPVRPGSAGLFSGP